MPNDLASLFVQPGDDATPAEVRQGVVESWDQATGENTVRVAGGVVLNIPAQKAGAAALKVGDVVTLLVAGNKYFILGAATAPGDPGTVPTWTPDISALSGQVDTIQTVTIPAVQNDVTVVQGDVVELNTVTVPAVQAAADAAQSTADAAQADATAALGKFPITETDISDGAISTPKLSANAIDGMVITGPLIRTAATGQRMELDSNRNGLEFYSGAAGELQAGSLSADEGTGYGSLEVVAPFFSGSDDARLSLKGFAGTSSALLRAASTMVYATDDVQIKSGDGAHTLQLTAAGGINLDGARVMVAGSNPQPVFVSDSTSLAVALSMTYVPGTPVVGASFVAPDSGKAFVTVGGRFQNETTANTTYLGFEVRTGATVGGGTVVTGYAADNGRAVGVGANATGFTFARLGASRRWLVTGLTPGTSYNARVMYAGQVAGGTATIFNRDLTIEPVL